MNTKVIFLIFISLVFLATNSILCKLALLNNSIDAYSFTLIRLLSACITLLILVKIKYKKIELNLKTNYLSGFVLFLYAITFSYAYLHLDAGLGTLILFASVQLSMIIMSFFYNEKLKSTQIIGILLAIAGLIYLLYPSDDFVLSYFHVFLIILSGISWAAYTVLGKNKKNILSLTSDNFTKASIFILISYFAFFPDTFYTKEGLLLASISGIVTSAFGYILWYYVLNKITIITASIVQLLVPIIAIIISIIFLNEILTLKLIISCIIILLGISICLL